MSVVGAADQFPPIPCQNITSSFRCPCDSWLCWAGHIQLCKLLRKLTRLKDLIIPGLIQSLMISFSLEQAARHIGNKQSHSISSYVSLSKLCWDGPQIAH